MAATKTTAEVDACAELAQNAVREGTVIDLSTCFDAVLHIMLALTTATAHTGTRVVVQTSGNSAGDEDWTDLWDAAYLIGTANLELITNNPAAAAETVFTVASTTGYVADGALDIFIEDAGTFANSEWMKMVSAVTDTSVTVQDGSAREHAVSSILYNVAKTIEVPLPFGAYRARVLYDNTYDADGSTIACKSRVVNVTAIS